MLRYSTAFLIIALLAWIYCHFGAPGPATPIARIQSFVFLALSAITSGLSRFQSTRH